MESQEHLKRLIPIIVSYSASDSIWTFDPQENGFNKFSFKADNSQFKKLLKRMRTKDSITYPNSKKNVTYNTMIDDIINKELSTIYVWRSKCPKSIENINVLLYESTSEEDEIDL